MVAVAKQILLAGAALGSALAGGAAQAQSLQGQLTQGAEQASGNFARDRNVSVTQRAHPGYEAVGLRAGPFMVWPRLNVSSDYNDNIFATPIDPVADGVAHISPEIDVNSNWSRHALQGYARGVFNQYWENSDQNTNDFSVGARGQLDIQRSARINGAVDFSRLTEPRTSAATEGNAFPTQYDLTTVRLSGAKEFNRLRISGRVDWRHFDYHDRIGNFPQGDRDRNETVGTVRADYAVSPATAFFVEVAGNDRSYRLSSSPIVNGAPVYPDFIDRDSHGFQVLAGANVELGSLVRGELGLGYLQQTYKDPRFGEVSGPGASAQIEWFPSQLITVTFTGARTVEDAGIVGAPSYLSTTAGVRVDHELLRNLLLNAYGNFGRDEYKGVSRTDERFVAGFGGTYLVSRSVGLSLGYSHYKQTSHGSDPSVSSGDFSINRVAATLTLQY
jgi:hypothetical protein